MKFALDAMGGDNAPREIVRGAVEAVREMDDIAIVLVGDRDRINPILDTMGAPAERLDIFHCTESVGMDEKPAQSLKSKPDSSIKRAAELVAAGETQGLISAGSTGAQVAASSLIMRLIPGVARPGIAVNFPGDRGLTTTIDVGANPYCQPRHLFEYGIMGSVFQQYVLGRPRPRVGLLSIGEEKGKGNSLTHETTRMFEGSSLNFIGNVEGNAIFTGQCDVLVCDGFAGNIMLKVSEGIGERLHRNLLATIESKKIANAQVVIDSIGEVMSHYDYSAYGGAPLFGVMGVSIICHGRSNSVAIVNAVKSARESARCHLTEHIVEELEKNKSLLEPTTK